MKKILLFLAVILLVNTILQAQASRYDSEVIYQELQKCNIENTSKCYQTLYNKYKSNEIRYYYAVSLANEKKISNAKIELQNIIRNESKNKQLIAAARQTLSELDNLTSDMKSASIADRGDYLNELADTTVWEHPSNIKVYIKGNTGKELILQNAFQIWDKYQGKIHFSFVKDETKADITCYYVDRLSGKEAGVTKFQTITRSNGKKYFVKAIVEIARNKSTTGGKYTDAELLSVTLHEVGHAIGITSHSDNINDIMYYSTATYRNSTLSNRDINTVRKLYK